VYTNDERGQSKLDMYGTEDFELGQKRCLSSWCPSCFQVQATVVGFLASIAAVIFGWIPEGNFNMGHAVLLCASSVATAFIASLLLGERLSHLLYFRVEEPDTLSP